MKKKAVLLLFADRYYLVKQVYPFGLDLIANYLRQCGHEVTIATPFLPDPDPEANVVALLERTDPDIIGLGIRNLDTCMSCEEYGDYAGNEFRSFYFLPHVRGIVDSIRKHAPLLPLVAGGGAFTISPASILKYLGVEYGVVGDGNEPLRRFIEAFPDKEKISGIPNMVYFDGGCRINPREDSDFKTYSRFIERDGKFNYAFETAGLPVQVKRGCNQGCSYCVEPLIEGRSFRFRETDSVIKELKSIAEVHEGVNAIFFVDTEFNLPDLKQCSLLVERIIKEGLNRRFSFSSQFLPKPFGPDFAEILAEAGFSIILTCDSFADEVLEKNLVSYREADIKRALEICEKQGIGCTLSMIFGLPGETHDTIDYSLARMKEYPHSFLRRYEYTIGGRIYQGTPLCAFIEKSEKEDHLYGNRSEGYIEPYYFCSPESPIKLKKYIDSALGYPIIYENAYDEARFRTLSSAYLADQGRWEEATSMFLASELPVRSMIYEYLFRRLSGAGRVEDARDISENLLGAIKRDGENSVYGDQIELIRFYLSCLS